MDSTVIYLFLGVILLFNIVFMVVFMKNKAKKPVAAQPVGQPRFEQQEAAADEEAKTQALGSNQPQNQPVQEPVEEKTEVLSIANLTPQEKAMLGKEADETMILGAAEPTPVVHQKVLRSVIYQSNGTEEVYKWDEAEVLVIGRDPQQCDLTITTDKFIGRTHALVYQKHSRYYLVDLDSKNGTYIDNLALKGQQEISLDEAFKLGQTEIVVK
ncbi:FHA domain-containing protein [Metabacillus malikii]|uniref:FHA domain-containing protein n=1 Tax=Metabacillus malikii TaxID=1504265 RepID=A0ABT9ZGR1_9BACI|nr:FHA domain-containing protein [Metabacillus malikii]MDQ0231473.1 hypothetical protein [Metabacillus malikii]